MEKFSDRKDRIEKESGRKILNNDKNKDKDFTIKTVDDKRFIQQKESIIIIPFMRDTGSFIMKREYNEGWEKDAFIFPRISKWKIEDKNELINECLERNGINLKENFELYDGPEIMGDIYSNAKYYTIMVNMGYWSYEQVTTPGTNYLVDVERFMDVIQRIPSSDISAAFWALNIIGEERIYDNRECFDLYYEK